MSLNKPNKVILHCTGTEDYDMFDPDFDSYGIDQARDYHMRVRKYKDVAYHYFIRRTGEIEQGRQEEMNGAHCYGQNKTSIGVAYAGSKDPTHEQIQAMCELFIYFYDKYDFGPGEWFGHNEYGRTECPGISMIMLQMLFQHVLHDYINKR